MTITEAVKAGIERVRRPIWGFEDTYLRIQSTAIGWLFGRREQGAIGVETPQWVRLMGDQTDDYVAYTGEIDIEDT